VNAPDFSLLTDAEQDELLRLLEAEAEYQALNEMDSPEWLRRYFPQDFNRPFTSQQVEFWDWSDGITPDSRNIRPRVQCDPRGLGKSTSAESLVVKLMARCARRYCLYISATDDQAVKHLLAIKRRLETPQLLRDYPHLAPKLEKTRGAIANWSRQRLVLGSGAVIEAVSLLGHMRGFKSEDNIRPDLMILDDIDADPSAESQDVVQKKLNVLKTEILPAGGEDTVVLFAQNLIHRDSICAQILDHRADVLSEREFSGPHRLMRWYDAQKIENADGSRRWHITAGDPADPAISIEYCQALLNRFGREAFDRECQQEVNKVSADKDFREWDELLHVVTASEVLAGFRRAGVSHEIYIENGRLVVPSRWQVGLGLDWGTTRPHPSVCAVVARPDDRFPFSDCYFVLGEIVKPDFPFDTHSEPELVSPGRVARAIKLWLATHQIADSQVVQSLMSHEASAAQNTFLIDLPESEQVFFSKWQAARGSGVPQIQNLLEVSPARPHPFRIDPRTKTALMGRPRLFFVVADGQGEIYADSENKLRVRGPKDAAGMARGRYEVPLYSHRNAGKKKLDDDFVDAFRGIMAEFALDATPLTETEKAFRQARADVADWQQQQRDQGAHHLADVVQPVIDQGVSEDSRWYQRALENVRSAETDEVWQVLDRLA